MKFIIPKYEDEIDLPLFHKGHEIKELRWIGNGQYVTVINGRQQRIESEVTGQAQDAATLRMWWHIQIDTRLLVDGEICVHEWRDRVRIFLFVRIIAHRLFRLGGLDPKVLPRLKSNPCHPKFKEGMDRFFGFYIWADKEYLEETIHLILKGDLPLEYESLSERIWKLMLRNEYISKWHEVAPLLKEKAKGDVLLKINEKSSKINITIHKGAARP